MRHHDSSVAGINSYKTQLSDTPKPKTTRSQKNEYFEEKNSELKQMYCKFLWPDNVGSQLVQLYSQIK